MTKNKAIDYSLIKWKHAMETGCNSDELYIWLHSNHLKVYNFLSECGLCEKYASFDCTKCPLYKKWDKDCGNSKFLFDKWLKFKTKKTRIKYATLIYFDIESLKEE